MARLLEGKHLGMMRKNTLYRLIFLFVAYVYDCLEQLLTLHCPENEIKTCDECDECGQGKHRWSCICCGLPHVTLILPFNQRLVYVSHLSEAYVPSLTT